MPAKKKYFTEEERKAAIKRSQEKYRRSEKGKRNSTKWYHSNKNRPEIKERYRAYTQKWWDNLTEDEKKERREANNKRSREDRIKDPRADMLNEARKRAKKKGINFDLCKEDITIPLFCPVLGIPLQVGKGAREHGSPSLDRFDNTKGYTKGNVFVISLRANTLKNDATPDEMRKILEYMEGRCLGLE